MADPQMTLLKTNLKQLRLPTISAEFEKLAREAAQRQEPHETYLLQLTELEVASRHSNALQARIKAAGFPVHKDFDTFDFSAVPALNKHKVLELARGEWIHEQANVCLVGSPGMGKTHLAMALGLAACRLGKRVRFFYHWRYETDQLLGRMPAREERKPLPTCSRRCILKCSSPPPLWQS